MTDIVTKKPLAAQFAKEGTIDGRPVEVEQVETDTLEVTDLETGEVTIVEVAFHM